MLRFNINRIREAAVCNCSSNCRPLDDGLKPLNSGLNQLSQLEEKPEAAARKPANDGGCDGVRHAAERESRECADNNSANPSEDVGVCRDFEFFVSHSRLSSSISATTQLFFASVFFERWGRQVDAGRD
jgi:hypothetical protein